VVIFFSILIFAYCMMLVIMIMGWLFPSEVKNVGKGGLLPFISVVIPVRNEKENILALLSDLDRQDYPSDFFEVIIVDDQSDDGTYELISSTANNYGYKLKHYRLPHIDNTISTKKKAIQLGVEMAKGEYILTTDGDCRVSSRWVLSYGRFFISRDTQFAAGMVAFHGEQSFFHKLQSAEFAVLTGIGAASIRLGIPGMCNAANMAFNKQAFLDVGGYKNYGHIISGDDTFLLEKFKNLDPRKIRFLKDPNAIVHTSPQSSFRDFYNQRKRWASKWKLHKNFSVALMALFLFLFHAVFFVALGLTLTGNYPPHLFLFQIFIKMTLDFAFLRIMYGYLGKRTSFSIFMALETIYPIYAVFFGIAANVGGFTWKGREYGAVRFEPEEKINS
jgi:poly-beta-1,6-N-acetyl-D-glucosamine synthase